MVQSLLVLALAGLLSLGLTSCGPDSNQNANGTNPAGTAPNGTYDDGVDSGRDQVGMNGTGGVGDINNDAVGNADAYTNDNAEARASRSGLNTPNIHRSAYDYLNDGRYVASSDGNIVARKDSVASDLTQGARDLIRGAGDVVRDAGRGVGDAARDVSRATKDTVRDMTR